MPRILCLMPSQLRSAPVTAGVYVMRNRSRKVIYVGKAINLRRRLQSHFRSSNPSEWAALVATVSLHQTGSELEALLLEARLIKKYQPYYNVKVKDFAHHVYLKVSRHGQFPQVAIVREPDAADASADFYGPFSGRSSLSLMLDGFNHVFRLRTCDLNTFLTHADHPCVRFEEGLCEAPCAEMITGRDYRERLREFIAFLQGAPSRRVSDFLRDADALRMAEEAALQAEQEAQGLNAVEDLAKAAGFAEMQNESQAAEEEAEEEDAEDYFNALDPVSLLTEFLPVNFERNNFLLVLPGLREGAFRLLPVLRGVPMPACDFDPARHRERRLNKMLADVYAQWQTMPEAPVPKQHFEEAKLADRWIYRHGGELAFDLDAHTPDTLHYRLLQAMMPACQLSLFYEAHADFIFDPSFAADDDETRVLIAH